MLNFQLKLTRMKICKIYKKYKTMPKLQLHMFKVAGVALMICENIKKPINKDLVVSTCLIHDIGNVVKFDFQSKYFPDSWFAPQGRGYWKKIKREFIKKYGSKDYLANYLIAKELKIPQDGLKIIKSMKLRNMIKIYKSNNFNLKICEYSDLRVKPNGVCSLKERLDEGFSRYNLNHKLKSEKMKTLVRYIYKLEKQIFKYCKIKPEDITENKIKSYLNQLKNFEVKTQATNGQAQEK